MNLCCRSRTISHNAHAHATVHTQHIFILSFTQSIVSLAHAELVDVESEYKQSFRLRRRNKVVLYDSASTEVCFSTRGTWWADTVAVTVAGTDSPVVSAHFALLCVCHWIPPGRRHLWCLGVHARIAVCFTRGMFHTCHTIWRWGQTMSVRRVATTVDRCSPCTDACLVHTYVLRPGR